MMKLIKTILCIQLALSLVGGFLALVCAHGGEMSATWAFNLQVAFEKMKQSPDYREPPPIGGESFAQILERLRASGHARADVAFYWLWSCGASAVFAALMLWSLGRILPFNNRPAAAAGTTRRPGIGPHPPGTTQVGP